MRRLHDVVQLNLEKTNFDQIRHLPYAGEIIRYYDKNCCLLKTILIHGQNGCHFADDIFKLISLYKIAEF